MAGLFRPPCFFHPCLLIQFVPVLDVDAATSAGIHVRTFHASLLGRALEINDPVEYKKYTDLVPAIIAKYGGKVLARAGRFRSWRDRTSSSRFVVIEFPTFEQGVACFQSDEYNKAAAFRRANGAGEVETIMVDGGDATQ